MSSSKLPPRPSLEHLKKLAKHRLQALRRTDPDAKLAAAQLLVAREHGFASWRALKAELDGARAKRIDSPVMRELAVTDLARSTAFYRDVLGFHVEGAEATLGPARIHLVIASHREPPGTAVLFLQCPDLEATHAAVQRASPSAITAVNWIKMRMFELRDPDGNVVWFGQSYHRVEPDSPSRRSSQPRGMRQALPELPFDDVAAAVAYYRDVLGFRINYQQADLGVMDRDAITVLLIARSAQHTGIGSFEVYVDDVDALHAELAGKHANVLGPPVSHPWGLRDFRVLDLEGNRLTFAQTFE